MSMAIMLTFNACQPKPQTRQPKLVGNRYEKPSKRFIDDLKKELRQSNFVGNSAEPEDDLFIYKQLMTQNI